MVRYYGGVQSEHGLVASPFSLAPGHAQSPSKKMSLLPAPLARRLLLMTPLELATPLEL